MVAMSSTEETNPKDELLELFERRDCDLLWKHMVPLIKDLLGWRYSGPMLSRVVDAAQEELEMAEEEYANERSEYEGETDSEDETEDESEEESGHGSV
jgi:hypothetical protein